MILAYSDWHCLVFRHQLSPLLLQGDLLSSRAKAGPPSSAGVCVAVLARFWWVVWPWQSPRTFFMRQICCSLCCSFPPYPEFCHGTPWGGVGVLSVHEHVDHAWSGGSVADSRVGWEEPSLWGCCRTEPSLWGCYNLASTLSELCHEKVSFFCFVMFLFSVNAEMNLILIDISMH